MPRKTDANNPADWLWLAGADLEVVRLAASNQVGFNTCRSKLAEALEKTHDLDRLLDALVAQRSELAAAAEPLCDSLADVYFTDRYPGFDLDDPEWPGLVGQIQKVEQLADQVRARLRQ